MNTDNLIGYIILGLIVIGVVVFVGKMMKRAMRRHDERIRRQVLQGADIEERRREQQERVEQERAQRRLQEEQEREARRREQTKEARRLMAEAKAIADPVERYEAVRDMSFDDDVDDAVWDEWEALEEQIGKGYLEALLDKARTGDSESFEKAVSLVEDIAYSDNDFKYPSDWNVLVARFIEEPELDDFQDVDELDDPKEIVAMAHKAIEENDFTNAVLAALFIDEQYDEVGEYLVDQLIEKMKSVQKP